jgi:hypothetical protein
MVHPVNYKLDDPNGVLVGGLLWFLKENMEGADVKQVNPY